MDYRATILEFGLFTMPPAIFRQPVQTPLGW